MNNTNCVKIYRRLLKYPPWAPSRRKGKMEIVHQLKNNKKITASAPEYVSVNDAEKLYAAIYKGFETAQNIGEEVKFTVHIKEIRKLTNSSNDEYTVAALERITGLTIKYSYENCMILFHIINRVEYDKETGFITIKMPQETYITFKTKALTLDIVKFIELNPISKNIYGYISSNSNGKFKEELIIERACITAKRKDKGQNSLKKSLIELKQEHIIKDFKIVKEDGQRYITLEK